MLSGVDHFLPNVQKIWDKCISGTPMFQVTRKLKLLKSPLKELNRDLFGDVGLLGDIIGADICGAVSDFFTHGKLLKQVNHTLVSLIPKVPLPENVAQFRPMSCCNVLYKIYLNCFLQDLPRFSLLLSVLTKEDLFRVETLLKIFLCVRISSGCIRASVSPRCLIKVDLKKAYDLVNWSFLLQMLRALNFPPHFIAMLKECVTTASYSLVLNGEPFGFFQGKQGLR
ncbi:uncharacterized protein LOC141601744 [Silene latifolia]|uniref:uncharacterized protein LOC141601744 n=1 Tax=Silene latifolia TaxID=37657 RepID=UPI003D77F1B9